MTAFERSAQSKRSVAIRSSCGRPDPIPKHLKEGNFT
jgi:hypothetical protein